MMIARLTWGLPIANRFAWNVLAVDAFRESLPVIKCLVESCGCVDGGEQKFHSEDKFSYHDL